MKNALVNIESRRIHLVSEEGILITPDGFEIISISNSKAEAVEASTDPLFLVNGELKTVDDMKEIRRFQRNSERMKDMKKLEIKKARDDEYNSNLVTSDGLHFKADLETIIDVKSIIEMLPDGGSYADYKNADGSYNTISTSQFQNAIVEGIQRKSAVFGKEKVLTGLVDAAVTADELRNITW